MTKKRDLFDEMTEGFHALADQRAGKRTLGTRAVKVKAAPSITALELAKLRQQLDLS
jgi:putative transcriptional regulator